MRLLLAARAEQPSPLVSGGEFLSLRSTPPASFSPLKFQCACCLRLGRSSPRRWYLVVSFCRCAPHRLHVFSSLKFQCACCLRLGRSSPRRWYLVVRFLSLRSTPPALCFPR